MKKILLLLLTSYVVAENSIVEETKNSIKKLEDPTVEKAKDSATKKDDIDDEELQLMFNSFLYTKDLPHAYEIAKKAIQAYPKSMDWHQRLADVALWSGKNSEAMDHMVYIYQHNNDPKLAKKIIKQMLASYQYEKALPVFEKEFIKTAQHSNNEMDKIVDVYEKVGRPEEAIITLQKLHRQKPSANYLSSILALQMELGDIKGADKSVKELIKYRDKSPKTALSLSKYYFLKKNLTKSYAMLLKAKKTKELNNTPYFERLSDLSSYMNDDETALYAALILYKHNKARMTDLSRINKIYKNTDITLLKNVSQVAIKKFQKPELYLDYLNKLQTKKDFNQLDKSIDKVLSNKTTRQMIENSSQFWLIKASVDEHFKREDDTRKDLQKALSFSSNASSIQATILWSLIDHNRYKALAQTINDIEKQENISSELYHPLSAAYLTLQKTDKAMEYFNKIDKNSADSISLKFLHVEILSAMEKKRQKRKILKNILTKLNEKKLKNPQLVNDKQFMREYVQASLEFLTLKEADILIESKKDKLTKNDYLELKITLALKEKNYKKAATIYKDFTHKSTFTELDIAQLKKDTKSQKSLMQQLSFAAPHSLKIKFAEDIHDMQKAMQLSKDAIKDNKQNKSFRSKLAQLQRDYATKISANAKYQKRGDLKVSSLELENFYYLLKGYGIISKLEYYNYKNDNNNRIRLYKKDDTLLKLGLRKHIKDGKLEAILHYRDALRSDTGFSLNAEKTISDNLAISAKLEKNAPLRDESDILMIGGKKDAAFANINYTINNKQNLSLMLEQMNLYDFDDAKVGHGTQANISWNYTFVEESNSAIRLMYRMGKYKEDNTNSSLSTLLTNSFKNERFTPSDYNDIGIGFSYGNNNQIYGTKWQPYIDIALFYNKKEKKSLSDINAGFIGSFSKENLYQVDLAYQNNINGKHYENYGINFSYSYLY